MNHLLAAEKENAEKHGIQTCVYCKKAFNNHQALGGHLRAHQEAMRSRNNWNYPDHSSNPFGISSLNLNTISHNQNDNPSGGSGNNLSTVFSEATSSSTFSNRFCSNPSGQLNATRFSENNLGNANSQFIMYPNLSSGYGNAEFHYPHYFPSTAFAPFGSPAATGFPLDPSCVGSDGVFQYNFGEYQSCMGNMSFPSADALQNFQFHNLSNLPYPGLAASYPHSAGLGSNQPVHFKEPTTFGPVPPNPCQCPGIDEVGQYKKSSILTCEGGKRPYSDDLLKNAEIMNLSKRPKIGLNPRVEKEKTGKTELSLFNDVENSFSGMAISSVMKEECEADLDLSLRL